MSSKDFISELAFLEIEIQEQHQANHEDEIIEIDVDNPEEVIGLFKYHNSMMEPHEN